MFRKRKEQSEAKISKTVNPEKGQEALALSVAAPTVPRYAKPKILLVDLKDDSEAVLKAAGYAVNSGTFGTPYYVEKSSSYRAIATDFNLPNYAEQEIVIVDLVAPETLSSPRNRHQQASGEYEYWGKCSYGELDPRLVATSLFGSDFDKILLHGGVFVVFADQHTNYEILLGRATPGGLDVQDKSSYYNWSFLEPLRKPFFETHIVHGTEIKVLSQKDPVSKLLARHLTGARFNCTLFVNPHIIHGYTSYSNEHYNAWKPLATDKYNAPVSGVFVPHDNFKGWVFIFPQLAGKSRFLLEFVRDVLPEMAPELFPYAEGGQWVYRDEYQLPSVLGMKLEIEEIEVEARTRVKVIEEKIQVERKETAYLLDLLRETGDPLVKTVKKTLEVLGFSSVLDMDEEGEKTGEAWKREDLRIVGEPKIILVEVKGIAGFPTDTDALQVQKYVMVRMRELSHTNVHGLEIINHQKGLPALDREQAMPFREDIIVNAEDQQFGLMTTWDLYRLARNFIKHNWKPEYVKGLFMGSGRIEPIPAHYEFVGVIERYAENLGVVGVRVQSAALYEGDRIAFEQPIEFEEQGVGSLEVDNMKVTVAEVSMLAGIKTHLAKLQLRKGIRVYRINSALE